MISLVQHNVIFWQTRTQDVVAREHITNKSKKFESRKQR